ncbi:hypothetical protein KAJ89_05935 [Candidatus Parcubacteria bacterium]|nr:hypothetical protein [Candidatus Parcubacteria bacterium]
MTKTIKHVLILACLVIILLLPYLVFASDTAPLKALHDIREDAGYAAADKYTISEIIGTIVSAFLGLLSVIFISLMLYAGYNWMTAGGDETKLTQAKNTIRRAIIGLIITVSSYAIWTFIFNEIIYSN